MWWKKKEKVDVKWKGLAQATGVAGYCLVVATLMINGNKWFGQVKNVFGPAMFLVLFSASVMVCGLLVFYQPYVLFFEGKKKEAIDTVVWTAGGLVGFFGVLMTLAVMWK